MGGREGPSKTTTQWGGRFTSELREVAQAEATANPGARARSHTAQYGVHLGVISAHLVRGIAPRQWDSTNHGRPPPHGVQGLARPGEQARISPPTTDVLPYASMASVLQSSVVQPSFSSEPDAALSRLPVAVSP